MIVQAETQEGLTEKALAALTNNWRPCGGIAVATIVTNINSQGQYSNAISFYQAFVREGGPVISKADLTALYS